LVSKGSDGRLDVANVESYVDLPETQIHGDLAHDIVFRDGEAVTLAGK
jgi:hypothetical protein